jgi:hypothetical protein
MLTPYSQPNLLERIFTDRAGRQFRMVFMVTVVNGELKGRLVSATPISASLGIAGATTADAFFLPVSLPKIVAETLYVPFFAPIVAFLNKFFFFTSQPTRAPSHK